MSSASRAVTICGALVALVLTPASSQAQATSVDASGASLRTVLPIGAHVRVRGQGAHSATFSGRLRAMSNDSITIGLDDSDPRKDVAFAMTEMGHVAIERDEKTRDQATAVMGAIGAAGGATAAAFWCLHNQAACQEDLDNMTYAAENDQSYIGPSLLMVLGGTLTGALLGYAFAPPPHWELIALPVRTSDDSGAPRLLWNVGLRYSLGGRRAR